MDFQTIRYMAWAKRTASLEPVRYHLAASAVEHVGPGDLGPLDGLPLDGPNAYGHPRLRAALAERYGVAPARVLCSVPGTSMANFLVAAALVRPGDLAVVERPGYEPLRRIFEALGARVERLERRAEERCALDLAAIERAFARGARVLAISNLMNPTGVVAARGEVRAAGAIAARAGGLALVDEVYLDGAAGHPDAVSAARGGEAEGIIVTSSLTKAYGLGGLRAGWAIAPEDVVERAYRVLDHTAVQHPFIADELALRALERLPELAERAARRRRENLPVVRAWAAREPGLGWLEPDGGFTAWVRLPPGWTSVALEAPLRALDAAVSPGHFFDAPDHVRIGFGGPRDALEEGLARISRVLAGSPPNEAGTGGENAHGGEQ